jgi:hypothetical protein
MSGRGKGKRRASRQQDRERDVSVTRNRLRRGPSASSSQDDRSADVAVQPSPCSRAQTIETPRWMDTAENWSVGRLLAELEAMDIRGMTSSMGKTTLLRIFKRNSEKASDIRGRGPEIEVDPNSSQQGQTREATPPSPPSSGDNNMAAPVDTATPTDISSEMTNIRRTLDDLRASAANISTHPAAINTRIDINSLPPVDIVTEKTRKDIIAGKYVNLALLIIPVVDNTNETKIIDSNGEQIVIKATDPRLQKSLDYHEFRAAFRKYKNVLCEAYPHRRAELDSYGDMIAKLYEDYRGKGFYQYHVSFARKAAQYQSHCNKLVDWSIRDTDLFLSIFGVRKLTTCNKCDGIDHTTSFCPQSVRSPTTSHVTSTQSNSRGYINRNNPNPKESKVDRQGRPRITFGGREICNNFNEAGCTRPMCAMLHLCRSCKQDKHTEKECQLSTKGQGPSK